ncbi:MAG TPA: hypothetical protein PLC15_02270 [Candidatus Obscuribacter sp.]|nr:hypothetical protein [Candidatus Obscuribacter sp.]MBK9280672.1 hypothetical protein [Candidatus Obscuribacter sp.]HMW91517.1 hypothetical protein [Candidatus Obscuribacter sp.]HMX45342.1 hypothetical protein [Candidatus Obscuribacter sp.]HMY03761.1 hypothetical protein [Candidatus Obscuribacter sp.]
MTWLEAFWLAFLALVFVRWHYLGHLAELERRISEFAEEIDALKLEPLSQEQSESLNEAVRLFNLSRLQQSRCELSASDRTVQMGRLITNGLRSSLLESAKNGKGTSKTGTLLA